MSKLHYGVSNISNTHCPLNNGVFFGGQNKWYKVLFFLDGLKCWRLTYVSSATKIMLLLAIWKDRNVDEWNQVWRKEEIKNVWHPNLRWKIQPLGSWQTLSIVRQEQHGRNRLRFKLWVMAFNLLHASSVDSKVAGSDSGDCTARVQSWSFWGPQTTGESRR